MSDEQKVTEAPDQVVKAPADEPLIDNRRAAVENAIIAENAQEVPLAEPEAEVKVEPKPDAPKELSEVDARIAQGETPKQTPSKRGRKPKKKS